MLLFEAGKRLEKAVGEEEEAAQIIIETIERLNDEQKKELATRGDVAAVRADLRETELRLQKEIETVRSELKTGMKSLELRLLTWQIGGFLALGAIMAKGFGWLGF